MNLSSFGMDSSTMSGTLECKLHAACDAGGGGFRQVTLWAEDLAAHPGGVAEAVRMVRASGLRVTGLQVLRDAEGLDGAAREHKEGIARQLLQLCRTVGAPLLLACSSTSPQSAGDVETIARDLSWLAQLAGPFGVKIGYEALSWGRHVNVLEQAWEVVDLAGHANLGVVVDAFHVLARPGKLDCLDEMPSQKIFLVQLSDFLGPVPVSDAERINVARHQRVFPGLGDHSEALAGLLRLLDSAGYRGDYSFEVANDDYLQLPAAAVAQYAHASARWVAGQVLPRGLAMRRRATTAQAML
jgi:sugar phosphate isomerase/epimerase